MAYTSNSFFDVFRRILDETNVLFSRICAKNSWLDGIKDGLNIKFVIPWILVKTKPQASYFLSRFNASKMRLAIRDFKDVTDRKFMFPLFLRKKLNRLQRKYLKIKLRREVY